MAPSEPSRQRDSAEPSTSPPPSVEGLELPILSATSQYAEIARPVTRRTEAVLPSRVERGVVVFDLDGTIMDDLGAISAVAADVLFRAFGTPVDEARIHYLATTGMPFEAQLAQLYPEAPAALRAGTARTFHQRKVTEAYAAAKPFPEVPKLLKRLGQERWTLAISTGAETEMADLILERQGLRYWFEDVLGSGDGTKREHLAEYRRRYPEALLFLVGDSRFDMEAAQSVPGTVAIGRASRLRDWNLTPADLKKWGAAWADYSLSNLPEALTEVEARPARKQGRRAAARRKPR
ncbi:MAG: HAD hydrolase-like protein [Thermoplasmata archaeon]|jgi:phosphoglycolate phosphatase-like HAD superfamily hydrolase